MKKIFKNVEALEPVNKLIEEASIALQDNSRTIKTSAIPDVLGAAIGSLAGGGVSFAALFLGGSVTGVSAAGITSGLSAAGAIVGGGMTAGVFVLAAPIVILGGVGYGVIHAKREEKLKLARQNLYNLALQKQQAIINALKQEANASKERIEYLTSLNILLQKAIEDLKSDINEH